jgi:hypothetical protein
MDVEDMDITGDESSGDNAEPQATKQKPRKRSSK